MAYVKNPNLQKLIDELQQDPVDDTELLRTLKEPLNKVSSVDNNSVNLSLNTSSIMESVGSNGVEPEVQTATRVQYNPTPELIEIEKKNEIRSASAHPSIPMLPSKETLDYARRISEQLGNTHISNNTNPRDLQFREQLLTLSNNAPGVHRNHTNYSSIGSGNLASESGTSHARYDTESEHEHDHFQANNYDEIVDTSELTIPPPRNKNRPKSHVYHSDEIEYNENIPEPPAITVQDPDNQQIRVVTGDNSENDESQNAKTNTYLQRPVPEEPIESNNDIHSVEPDFNVNDNNSPPDQQQQNINTLSQLISITNDTTVGTEFNQLEIPKDERILLEQFIDALSRLTADLLLDPSRRMESLRRLRSAARALEGF